jgi:hypothetical protein
MRSQVEQGKNIPRELLLDLQCNYSGDQIEKNEKGGVCSIYGERKCAYRVLVLEHDGRRPIGKSRPRGENSIKVDLRVVGCGLWTGFIWLRRSQVQTVVNMVMNLRVT